MGVVIELGCVTRLDLPPDRILENSKGKLEGVIVMGFDGEGEPYFASSYADGATVLWLLEMCKKRLLEISP